MCLCISYVYSHIEQICVYIYGYEPISLSQKDEVPAAASKDTPFASHLATPDGKVFVKMILEQLNATAPGETVVISGNMFEAHLIREICTEHRWQTQTQRDGQKCTISATKSDRFLTRKSKNKSKHQKRTTKNTTRNNRKKQQKTLIMLSRKAILKTPTTK